MAPRTSSLFEAPSTDAAPAAPDTAAMVAKASTTTSASSAGAESAAGATKAAPAVAVAVAPAPATQATPTGGASEQRMQAAKTTESAPREESGGAKTQTTPESAAPARYARVSPAVLQSVKASLSFRKSCLKRSKSSAPPPAPFSDEGVALPVAEKREEAEETPARPVQKNRRRCWECKAKVGLTAVRCRCDYTFCGKHRYAEEHACVFNFKTAGKRKLAAENPVVVPRKVARIN